MKYKVRLEANRKVFSGEGNTVGEACESLVNSKVDPLYKTRGILKAEYGKLKAERFLYLMQVRRFLGNKIFRSIVAKNLALNLK